jgi:hypothetical protein
MSKTKEMSTKIKLTDMPYVTRNEDNEDQDIDPEYDQWNLKFKVQKSLKLGDTISGVGDVA